MRPRSGGGITMRMHAPSWRRALVAPAAAAALLAAACGGKPAFAGPPVLVIGVDGLEWSVLEPLIASGRCPNLRALAERGVAGELETVAPAYSPVVWTSIATGAPPERHGILYFCRFENGRPGLPYTSNCRAVPAIWNVAGAHGRSVLSVAWWVSWPAEAVANGRIVASYAAQAQGNFLWKPGVWTRGLPELTWPPSLAREIAPALADGAPDGPLRGDYDAVFGPVAEEWRFERDLDRRFRFVYHADRTHLRIALEQLRAGAADLNLVYFGLPDVAGHYFWRYMEPERFEFTTPPTRVERLREHVRRAYEQVDAWVGELLAAAPVGARVLVLSDHGMHANRIPAGQQYRQVQSGAHDDGPAGVLIAAGPDIPARGILPAGLRRLGSVYDVFPTILDWLELPQPPAEESAGEPMRLLMDPEWARARPLRRGASYCAGFRAPTPPRLPRADADLEFRAAMAEIGYAMGGEDEPPPPAPPPRAEAPAEEEPPPVLQPDAPRGGAPPDFSGKGG